MPGRALLTLAWPTVSKSWLAILSGNLAFVRQRLLDSHREPGE